MKNNPVLGVVKADLFVRLVGSKDYTSAAIGLCISSACKVLLLGLFTRFSFRFGLHFHVSFVLDCSTPIFLFKKICVAECLLTAISSALGRIFCVELRHTGYILCSSLTPIHRRFYSCIGGCSSFRILSHGFSWTKTKRKKGWTTRERPKSRPQI